MMQRMIANAATSVRSRAPVAAARMHAAARSRPLCTATLRRAAPVSPTTTPAPSTAAPSSPSSTPASPVAAVAAVPVASNAFTSAPDVMPFLVPLSSIDLSSVVPRLPKHSVHGYLVYASPMERALKAVKMFSLTSAAMSILSAPVMLVLANPNMPMIGRAAIAGTVLVFGLSTTAALTYFTRSYVVRIFALEDPSLPAPAVPSAAALAAGADTSATDRAASDRWMLTVESLNMWGRPVFTTAPHSAFHPLFSRLFNNLRVDFSQQQAAQRGAAFKPQKKDMFIHMDLATNPLLLPLWAKPTIISSTMSPIESEALQAKADSKRKAAVTAATTTNATTAAGAADVPEQSMSVEQARRVLEARQQRKDAAAQSTSERDSQK